MLHAKDLMIGDYLRINRDGLCIKKGTVVEVRGIDADDKLIKKGLIGLAHCRPLDKEQFDGGIWCDYLDPIPLIPEILEKNGFVENRGITSWKFETKQEDLIDIYGVDDYHLSINIEDTHGPGKGYRWLLRELVIRYVHELQHALRLCGIKKEIEL